MKNFFEFDQDDKKLWLGLGVAGLIYIVAFTLFWGGLVRQFEKAAFFALEDILPGFVIMKLYLDKLSFSDNRLVDKLMTSFALSLMALELPYFLTTYIRPYVFNTDEEGWSKLGLHSNTIVTLVLLVLVLGIAFGVKYYQNKKSGLA